MTLATIPRYIGHYANRDAEADHLAWRKEFPNGRDFAGLWQTCTRCGMYYWNQWGQTAHRGRHLDYREGKVHTCREVRL